jgi:hypothetical protein
MSKAPGTVSRREFMAGMSVAAGGLALGSIPAARIDFGSVSQHAPPPPRPLRARPVLAATLYDRREQTSWRPWGGLHSQQDISDEQRRIGRELTELSSRSEFELEILPLVTVHNAEEAARVAAEDHDVLLMYAANTWLDVLEALTNPGKWTILFVRHRSGPVYLWYEIAHNRFLRKTVDEYGQPGMDHRDVVVDDLDETLWRLRALAGLKNTLGKRIVTIGGPAGWGAGGAKAPDIARDFWKMDLRTVEYAELGEMIRAARGNNRLVEDCARQADQYLSGAGVSHDHADLGDYGVPALEPAQRLRLHRVLRIRFRRHPLGDPAAPHHRSACVPERPDIPAPRGGYTCSLYRTSTNGRQHAGTGQTPDTFRVRLWRSA